LCLLNLRTISNALPESSICNSNHSGTDMFRKINILFILGLLLTSGIAFSQTHSFSASDSLKKEPTDKVHRHSPRAAWIMSACIPGLGQAYNKKYWKIPLVYASMGTTLYFFNMNNKIYREYKQAYINKADTLKSTVDVYPLYPASWLQEQEHNYRKYRDLNFILTALFYTLNIADAYVDAHLMNFDVSDDLSLQVFPSMNFSAATRKPSAGLTFALTF
jgi:hypothetical protein